MAAALHLPSHGHLRVAAHARLTPPPPSQHCCRTAQPCLAGQPINSLEQAAGCTATLPNLPFTPSATVTVGKAGRKLSMISPARSLFQAGGNGCSTSGQDGGGICPASHNGLGSASLSYGAVGLGQSSSACPPVNVNFVLAGESGGRRGGQNVGTNPSIEPVGKMAAHTTMITSHPCCLAPREPPGRMLVGGPCSALMF